MKRICCLLLMLGLMTAAGAAGGENGTPAGAENAGGQIETVPLAEEGETGEGEPAEDESDLPEEEDLEEEILDGRELKYGDEGDDVLTLQNRLKDLKYYTGNLSGRYREGTRDAVRKFQGDYGLEKTGVADLATQDLIFSAKYRPLRYGASGDEVRRLQIRLTELGFFTGKVTGSFREETQKSVRAFQEAAGITATGAADAETLEKLYTSDAPREGAGAGENLSDFLVGGGNGDPAGTEAAAGETGTAEAAADAGTDGTAGTAENTDGAAGSTAYTKTLKSGSSGKLVKQLQARMTTLGYYDGPVSGNFAKKTLRAVKTIQTQNGLKATGQVDENTWNVIFNDPGIVLPGATPKPTPEPTPVPYAMTVDVTNQVTTVYGLDETGAYTVPVRRMLCSTGTKANPSDVGDWVLNGRHAKWCEFPKWGNSYARYWTRINSNIAFHSVIYTAVDLDAMKTSSYKALGSRASHGCIRLTVADAKWVYENIGAGTVVSIREDLPADPELRDALKLPALKKGTSIPVETPVPTPEPDYDPAAAPEFTRKLKKNSEGPEVYWVQTTLAKLGYYQGYVGGKMLNGTVNALKQFQKASGIYAGGEVDQKTMDALKAAAEGLAAAANPGAAVTAAPETATPAETLPAPTPTPGPEGA